MSLLERILTRPSTERRSPIPPCYLFGQEFEMTPVLHLLKEMGDAHNLWYIHQGRVNDVPSFFPLDFSPKPNSNYLIHGGLQLREAFSVLAVNEGIAHRARKDLRIQDALALFNGNIFRSAGLRLAIEKGIVLGSEVKIGGRERFATALVRSGGLLNPRVMHRVTTGWFEHDETPFMSKEEELAYYGEDFIPSQEERSSVERRRDISFNLLLPAYEAVWRYCGMNRIS